MGAPGCLRHTHFAAPTFSPYEHMLRAGLTSRPGVAVTRRYADSTGDVTFSPGSPCLWLTMAVLGTSPQPPKDGVRKSQPCAGVSREGVLLVAPSL